MFTTSRRSMVFMMLLGAVLLTGTVVRAETEQGAMGKTLIMYYSLTGNTQTGCEILQQELGADILEIKDLKNRHGKWGFFCAAISSLFGRHTKIDPAQPDLSEYENIIIGSPIWTGKLSIAIRTLIAKNSFSGKQVILYTTTNAPEQEKYKEKSRQLVRDQGGAVVGYYQVLAREEKNGEKVPRSKEEIAIDTRAFVPQIRGQLSARDTVGR